MEAAQPRSQGSQFNIKASPLVVQMHSVHSHVWHVQTVREPRVLRAQCGGQASHGQEQVGRTPGQGQRRRAR